MPPLLAQPAVHCSDTWISERSLPGRSLPPQSDRYVPMPASSSNRLVAVIVHVACLTRLHSFSLFDLVSGATVFDPGPGLCLLACSVQHRLPLLLSPFCAVMSVVCWSCVCVWLMPG